MLERIEKRPTGVGGYVAVLGCGRAIVRGRLQRTFDNRGER